MTSARASGTATLSARSARRRSWLYAAHLCLAAAFAVGRALRWVQAATLADESSFATSPTGRALAFLAMIVGITALASIAVLTVLERRDARALALAALLGAALAAREDVDALDVAYLVATLGAALWWILGRRKRSSPAGGAAASA